MTLVPATTTSIVIARQEDVFSPEEEAALILDRAEKAIRLGRQLKGSGHIGHLSSAPVA